MAVPDDLREQVRSMARADRDALIAEARAEAREQVKALLREEYAKALLARAPRPEPAPKPRREEPAGEGWWVYCVVPADRELPDGLEGLAGDPPRLIAADGLAALAARVPLSEYGEAPLRENLNDLGWLERTVRAHESVLDAMLAGGALVPMRVCTIYSDEAHVRELLKSSGPVFEDALARVAGAAEWGVKVVAQRERLEEHARTSSDEARALASELSTGAEGGAYLARKKLAALVRDEADRLLDEVVRETHARLEEWAAASVVLPAQSRELAGYEGEMVFNGAYLVEDDRVEAFAGLLEELRAQYAPLGLAFDLTGPWPPYNFTQPQSAREVPR